MSDGGAESVRPSYNTNNCHTSTIDDNTNIIVYVFPEVRGARSEHAAGGGIEHKGNDRRTDG